jgi:molecular chaperone DnaK
VEKALEEAKDKLPDDKAKEAKDTVSELRAAIDKQDDDAIASGTEKLEKLMSEIAQSAYAAAGGEGQAPGAAPGGEAGGAAGGGKKADDVIDAEFEENS